MKVDELGAVYMVMKVVELGAVYIATNVDELGAVYTDDEGGGIVIAI